MKYVYGIALGVALAVGGVCAVESEAADVLYAGGHWEQALTAYKKESESLPVGHLLRMGECALKTKKYAEGLAYLHKALGGVYWLLYYEVARKIAAAETEIGVRSAGGLTPQWYIATVCACVPPLVWQIVCLLLLLLFLWYVRAWYEQRRWMSMGFLLAALGLLGATAVWSIAQRSYVGGVIAASAKMRVGPDDRFNERGVLSLGTPVHVCGQARVKEGPLFYKVSGKGRSGWVEESAVQLVG